MDFPVPADYRVKIEESEKRDKYLDLARKLKKLWTMKVTVIPIVVRALGTIPKGMAKELKDLEIRGQVETIQTTALLRSAGRVGNRRTNRNHLETKLQHCRDRLEY